MTIGVVDGQGGGIGKALVAALRERLPGARVLALGTNAMATAAMIKAGATDGATGERAIVVNAPKCDVLCGVVAIVMADALMGELTPAMATAIAQSPAHKVLIPQNRCGITVAGITQEKWQAHIAQVAEIIAGGTYNADSE